MLSICVGKSFLYQRRLIEYIGEYSKWHTDTTLGILELDTKVYDVEYIGTTSTKDNYWYSADFYKELIPIDYVNLLINTKKNLNKYDFNRYTETILDLFGNLNGYNLSMVHVAFCPSNVAYFNGIVDETGTSIHMFVKNLPDSIFEEMKSTEFIPLILEIISSFNVNHKLMIKALLSESNWEYIEENNKIISNNSSKQKFSFEFNRDLLMKYEQLIENNNGM